MTGPRVELKPLGKVLSGDEWEASQYVRGPHPTDSTKVGPASRILTGDEWEQAQTMPGPALKTWKIPALPKFAARDATQTALTAGSQKGTRIGGVTGAVMRQVVDPILENPFTTLATTSALASPVGPAVGVAMAGSMVYHIAQYGWQKAAESQLSPEDRARAEADPERISGESAAVQAAMLGLAPLIHVGVKAYRNLDVSGGMLEAGVAGVKETRLGPAFERAAAADQAKADYHLRRIAEDQADLKATPLSSILTDETNRVGEPARRPQKEALASSVKDYAEEDAADLAAARKADAEKVVNADALAPRRRAAGSPAPYFESPQGAETLGAVAARHGLPDDANPYHPSTGLAESWTTGHTAASESFKNMSETGFASVPGNEPSSVLLPTTGTGRGGSTVTAVARAKELVGPDRLREMAAAEWQRRGSPNTPESHMAAMEQVARDVASSRPTEPTPSYPDGFAMGGPEGRIPGASEVPTAARGGDVPEGATTETLALANALKPSRFRGHSADELADAALDAQTTLEQAPEGTSATAAKTKLAQIEREFSLRGIAGDALSDVMQQARAQRESMTEGQVAGKTTEDFAGSGPGEDPRRAGLLPVEGTGATRQRGLSAGVQRKAVVNKLATTIGDVPEYRAINMADQSDRAVALLESNPALARRVAMGEAPAPDGLLPESVFVAVENEAIMQGDVATIRDLATGKLTSEATTMGQRIRALGERDPESPVAAIKEVITVRMGGAKSVPRATAETVALIRAQLRRVEVTRESWVKFLDSLRC